MSGTPGGSESAGIRSAAVSSVGNLADDGDATTVPAGSGE